MLDFANPFSAFALRRRGGLLVSVSTCSFTLLEYQAIVTRFSRRVTRERDFAIVSIKWRIPIVLVVY
jgi:hypothetical protein